MPFCESSCDFCYRNRKTSHNIGCNVLEGRSPVSRLITAYGTPEFYRALRGLLILDQTDGEAVVPLVAVVGRHIAEAIEAQEARVAGIGQRRT